LSADPPARRRAQVMYYNKAQCRFPPYAIGMLLALLLVQQRRD
jgi:hypothetical protein